jgi:hypothetical protein
MFIIEKKSKIVIFIIFGIMTKIKMIIGNVYLLVYIIFYLFI